MRVLSTYIKYGHTWLRMQPFSVTNTTWCYPSISKQSRRTSYSPAWQSCVSSYWFQVLNTEDSQRHDLICTKLAERPLRDNVNGPTLVATTKEPREPCQGPTGTSQPVHTRSARIWQADKIAPTLVHPDTHLGYLLKGRDKPTLYNVTSLQE